MSFLKRSFQLGKKTLPSNIFYAPLAGCSDYPFRAMSAVYKPGLQYCEMVKMEALTRSDIGTFQMLDFDKSMHPIGGQICGSKPELAGKAARIIEENGFDIVDLNCGCPVDKVTKDGSGSGLLKNPELIGEIISNMVAAVQIPVTLKIRAGWDEDSIYAPLITQIAEKAGASAICIHGRTRAQGYKGPAKWGWIRDCVQARKTIKVIGNGDLTSPEAVERMFQETGADAALIARGTLGQPWIADDIYRYFEGLPPTERTLEDMRKALYEHFEITYRYQNDRRTILDLRRVGCWYLKKASGTRAFREKISRAQSIDEVRGLILNSPLGELIEEEKAEEQEDCSC
jgi:nifR3 family TIM-barrel protein